jgi:diaminopimelate epimerase
MVEPVSAPQKTIRSPEFRRVYANASGARISPLDVTLTFGFQGEIEPGVEAIQEMVTVSMSPQHLIVFVKLLQDTLNAHMAQFGDVSEGVIAGVNVSSSTKK